MEKYQEVFSCFDLLELETYRLYKNLHARMLIEDPRRGPILFIALDSYKHHLIYRELSKKAELGERKCAEILGEIYSHSLRSTRHLRKKISKIDQLKEKELKEIFNELMSYEKSVYEEAMSKTLIGFIKEEAKGEYREILKFIEEDEKRHESILKELIELF